MERRLFIHLFITGVVPLVLSVPRKYYLIQQGKTWSDAQTYCQAEHANLAIIESDDNMVQLQNEAQRQQFSSSAWISTEVVPLVLSVPRKYYLIQQGKTWSDAQTYCRAEHANLAIIESDDNMVQLQNEAQRQQFSSSAWIGMYNHINSWCWSLGNEPLRSMRPWAPGEPNNSGGKQSCGAIYRSGWCDKTCTDLYPSMCFDDSKTGTDMYIYISNTMTWTDAQAYCRTYHTDLASARDATENSIIQGLVSGYTWFGLFRDTWKWTDQTNFSTISWMPGKPDNALKNENCGYLNKSQAVDALCSDLMPFFCYSVITGQQQIMRMKVRSIQHVNEPAVNVAILEQIKQKLKDHQMADNITVTWREQPDGQVFHKQKENIT